MNAEITPESLRQTAAAMEAKQAGKPIQYRRYDSSSGTWWDVSHPEWEIAVCEYRPKPEPVSRPWNRETLPPLPFEVRHNVTKNRLTVVLANEDHVNLGAVGDNIKYDRLLEIFTMADGSPCGIAEPAQ